MVQLLHSHFLRLNRRAMTKQEAIDFAALQDRLAAKEAECRELRKELHDIRSHAQILQNKLALTELKYEDLLGKLGK